MSKSILLADFLSSHFPVKDIVDRDMICDKEAIYRPDEDTVYLSVAMKSLLESDPVLMFNSLRVRQAYATNVSLHQCDMPQWV